MTIPSSFLRKSALLLPMSALLRSFWSPSASHGLPFLTCALLPIIFRLSLLLLYILEVSLHPSQEKPYLNLSSLFFFVHSAPELFPTRISLGIYSLHFPWVCPLERCVWHATPSITQHFALVFSGAPSQHLPSTLAHSDICSTLWVLLSPICHPGVTRGASPGISPGPVSPCILSPQSLTQLPSSHSNCSINLKSLSSSLHQCFFSTLTSASRSLHTDQYCHPLSPLD